MATFPFTDSSGETSCDDQRRATLKRKSDVNGSDNLRQPKKKKRRKEKDSDDSQVYEVENVVDHRIDRKRHLYLVKWKDWPSESNTWEPSQHLDGCDDALFAYLSTFTNKYEFNQEAYTKLETKLSECTLEDLNNLLKEFISPKGVSIPPPDHERIDERLRIISRWPIEFRDSKIVDFLRHEVWQKILYEARQKQLDELKEWEREINSIIRNSISSPISVINNVDLEGPPENFIYINDYLPGEKVNIPEDPPVGCSCDSCSTHKKKCCPTIIGSLFAYDKEGRVKVPHGSPIYECNKRCKCGPECINRVVQRGRSVRLCIFRTDTGCGWGVKAMETIPKGAFVSEYVGEVITFDEAERRGKKYDREGQTYLFDLDFNDANAFPFTVDAAVYGNISHFVNHSCDPNMTVYAVWSNCLDPNIPKLALFANKEIKKGEEISFDYLNQSKKNKDIPNGLKKNGTINKKCNSTNMICKCGSRNCRKFYL